MSDIILFLLFHVTIILQWKSSNSRHCNASRSTRVFSTSPLLRLQVLNGYFIMKLFNALCAFKPSRSAYMAFFGFNMLMLSWLSVDFISGALLFDVLLSLRVGDVMRDTESVTRQNRWTFLFTILSFIPASVSGYFSCCCPLPLAKLHLLVLFWPENH